jgi:hypothetical protein
MRSLDGAAGEHGQAGGRARAGAKQLGPLAFGFRVTAQEWTTITRADGPG